LVVEASLAAGDKGEAVVELMARTGARSMVFAGDDVTDEPALRVAAANGLALFVASAERPEPPDGIACVVLDGPDTLAALLAELARVGS
jgi:trehalose 6-phosphate phosphatase